jgi:Na+/melibiose symporter-like transporter
MPDITPSEKRSQANGIINFMGGLGAIIAFIGGATLYKMNPAFPFWLGSILVILSAALVLIFIREPKNYEEGEKQPGMFASLQEVIRDSDKSALRILLAIFFWFIGYTAIEAFFTLYAVNQLGLDPADGARLLGQLSLFFVLFALVSGFIGATIGRKTTISIGLVMMIVVLVSIFLLPASTLTTVVTKLPVLGVVPVIGLFLMVAGAAWALININSLPMVVDMTTAAHRHIHRLVLPLLHAVRHRRAESQRLDHPVYGQQFQLDHAGRFGVHGCGAGINAGREARRGTANK